MPIDTVKVTVNGTTVTAVDNGDGTYTATLAAPNKTSYNVNDEHYYPVSVIATNKAGTATTVNDTHSTLGSSLRLFVREVTAPRITISAPTTGQYLASATPTIKFRLFDDYNGSGVAMNTLSFTIDDATYTNTSSGVTVKSTTENYSVSGTSYTNYGYEVSFVPQTPLADGEHTLKISVKDNDGNTATTSTRTFTTDTLAPTLSVTSPATNGTYTAESALNVTGTVSDSTSATSAIEITLNGTDVGEVTVSNGAFSKGITLVEGSNTIVVTATDLAGKVTTITRTIILDTSSPVVASVEITPNPVNVGGSYTVKITVE